MSGKQILISDASRELTLNILTALPRKSEGAPKALLEEPKLFVASNCRYDNHCHLIKIKAGRKCDCNPDQCQSFKFYQRYMQKNEEKSKA